MRIVRGLDFMNVVKCERDVKILIRSRKKWEDKEVNNEIEKGRVEWRVM